MDAMRYQRLKELTGRCLELAKGERAAFLEKECRGDQALLDEVNSLLDFEDSALGEHLNDAPGAAIPQAIDGYQILREIGRGAMGVVFEAQQDDPNRRVAMKVLGAAWITPEVTARFLREAEALARLSHPAIATVFETGQYATDLGSRPYFTMEYVEGREPIGFCEHHSLSLNDRLELLARIADAAHHAHQKGVVHRDLKPDNIIVRDDGLPKILDFGIAQVLDHSQDRTRLTEQGQILGTLDYLSPEQVAGEVAKVGPAADVYALGVIGFELLSGQMPYVLQGRSLTEAAKIIKTVQPARPGQGRIALPRDVETILQKALEKVQSRRYESAAAMAADIRRYLRQEPILARPPSIVYRVQRFAQRNREFVAATSAIFLILVTALMVTIKQAESLRSSRDAETEAKQDALGKKQEAEDARDAEKAARVRADSRLRQADSLTEFMSGMITLATPHQQGRELKVIDALKSADESIAKNFGEFPENEMAIRKSLGRLYVDLGLQEEAEECLTKALDIINESVPDDDSKSTILFHLTQLAMRRGDNDKALKLASEAIPLYQTQGSNPMRLASLLDGLAAAYGRKRNYSEALRISNQALELVAERSSYEAAILISNNGRHLNSNKRWQEGSAQGRRALAMMKAAGKADTPQYGFLMHEIARSLTLQGREEEALPLRIDAYALARKHLGNDHINVAALGHPLAELKLNRGHPREALDVIRDCLRIYLRTLKENHSAVLMAKILEARALVALNRLDEAQAIADRLWDPKSPESEARSERMLELQAEIAAARGQKEGEVRWRRRALALRNQRVKDGGVRTAELRHKLGLALLGVNKRVEAIEELKTSLADYTRVYGPEHLQTQAVAKSLKEAQGHTP